MFTKFPKWKYVLTQVSFTCMLHVNYNQCRLLLILFGEVHHTIITFPENALFVLRTHNLSFLVHVIVCILCARWFLSPMMLLVILCAFQFVPSSSAVTYNLYIQHLRSASNIIPCLQEQGFSIRSGGGKYRLLVKLPTVLSQYLPLVFFNFAVLAPYYV